VPLEVLTVRALGFGFGSGAPAAEEARRRDAAKRREETRIAAVEQRYSARCLDLSDYLRQEKPKCLERFFVCEPGEGASGFSLYPRRGPGLNQGTKLQ